MPTPHERLAVAALPRCGCGERVQWEARGGLLEARCSCGSVERLSVSALLHVASWEGQQLRRRRTERGAA
jgi:hypothetical protein